MHSRDVRTSHLRGLLKVPDRGDQLVFARFAERVDDFGADGSGRAGVEDLCHDVTRCYVSGGVKPSPPNAKVGSPYPHDTTHIT